MIQKCKKHGYWNHGTNPYNDCPGCSKEKSIRECEIEIQRQKDMIMSLRRKTDISYYPHIGKKCGTCAYLEKGYEARRDIHCKTCDDLSNWKKDFL